MKRFIVESDALAYADWGTTVKIRLATVLALCLCGTGCSDDDDPTSPPCVDEDEACGTACTDDEPCDDGLYCHSGGTCAKECTGDSSEAASDAGADAGVGVGCPSGVMCTADGRCPAPTSPCFDDDEGCGEACSDDEPCAQGLYCSGESLCSKECASTGDCDNLGVCNPDGRCEKVDINWDAGNGEDDVCADTTVTTNRVTPNVILIVDQSGSMDDTFSTDDNGNDVSRWNALRSFLLNDPDGLIADLQDHVRFGLALYSARNLGGDMNGVPDGECPLVTTVQPKLDNYADIAMAYNAADPIQDTPTGDAIDRIVSDLNLESDRPDGNTDPYIFILATDGNPDRCEQLNPHDDPEQRVESVEATGRAYDLGVRTFIISVGADIDEGHQQDVANAGIGNAPGDPDAEYWRAGDDATLKQALRSIVGGQIGCEVELDGMVIGDECDGIVRLNGRNLECNGDDGWELSDPEHILLKGEACTELKDSADALLDVTFPCGANVDVLL